jgi:hypothetical protein
VAKTPEKKSFHNGYIGFNSIQSTDAPPISVSQMGRPALKMGELTQEMRTPSNLIYNHHSGAVTSTNSAAKSVNGNKATFLEQFRNNKQVEVLDIGFE